MVYSGKEDYICNYVGGMEWTNATKWSQQVTSYFQDTVDPLLNFMEGRTVHGGCTIKN